MKQVIKNYNARYKERKDKIELYIGSNKDPRTEKFTY